MLRLYHLQILRVDLILRTPASSHESQTFRDPVDNSVSINFTMGPMTTSIQFASEEQFSRPGFQILQQAHSASLQLAMMSTQMTMNPTSHSMGFQMMPGAENMMPSIMSTTSPGATRMPAISAGASPGTRNQPALTAGDTPSGTRNQLAVAAGAPPGTLNLSVNASDQSSRAQQDLNLTHGVARPELLTGNIQRYYVAHNTDWDAAAHILHQGIWRPSSYDPRDVTWSPSSTFYAREHMYDEKIAMFQAAIHKSSRRPCCVLGRSILRQHTHVKPKSGGIPTDIAASMYYGIVRAKDGRWAFRVSTSYPTGFAVWEYQD